uniref:Uncharacterized protein n=1 Tax=Parascaris equorum TaxID=6256 RepID=A0A914S8M6_PAREQ
MGGGGMQTVGRIIQIGLIGQIGGISGIGGIIGTPMRGQQQQHLKLDPVWFLK